MMCKGEGVEWSHAGVKYEFHVPISYVKGIYGVENKLLNPIIFFMTSYLLFITGINNSTITKDRLRSFQFLPFYETVLKISSFIFLS